MLSIDGNGWQPNARLALSSGARVQLKLLDQAINARALIIIIKICTMHVILSIARCTRAHIFGCDRIFRRPSDGQLNSLERINRFFLHINSIYPVSAAFAVCKNVEPCAVVDVNP